MWLATAVIQVGAPIVQHWQMISCMFYVEDGSPPCRALQAINARALSPQETRSLERRYCLSGSFISCPVLARVQAGLSRARATPEPDQRLSA